MDGPSRQPRGVSDGVAGSGDVEGGERLDVTGSEPPKPPLLRPGSGSWARSFSRLNPSSDRAVLRAIGGLTSSGGAPGMKSDFLRRCRQ
jgi:hypothetical protein